MDQRNPPTWSSRGNPYYPPARGRPMSYSPPSNSTYQHADDSTYIQRTYHDPSRYIAHGPLIQSQRGGYYPRGRGHPVQNMGYMRQARQPGVHVLDAPTRNTAMPPHFEVPAEMYTLDSLSAMPPPPTSDTTTAGWICTRFRYS